MQHSIDKGISRHIVHTCTCNTYVIMALQQCQQISAHCKRIFIHLKTILTSEEMYKRTKKRFKVHISMMGNVACIRSEREHFFKNLFLCTHLWLERNLCLALGLPPFLHYHHRSQTLPTPRTHHLPLRSHCNAQYRTV